MLNPPLSRLSSEQLARIVEQIADDVDHRAAENLQRLSLVDRAFTSLCQSHLFKELRLDGSKSEMTTTLERAYKILKRKQASAVSFVRTIRLELDEQKDLSWLFQNQTFLALMGLLSNAPRPPHRLEIFHWNGSTTRNHELIVEGFATSFFSQSLESLIIRKSQIPESTLLISPTLKLLDISRVKFISDKRIVKADHSGSLLDRQLPKLRELDHRLSFNVVQRMLPSAGVKQVAELSQLHVLHMCPEDEENMTLAQPILDVAHEALEEIHLMHPFVTDSEDEQEGYLLLAPLLDFRRLHKLRIFELRSGIYDSDPDRLDVVKDITRVLSTIPISNNLARIYIRVQVFGSPPFEQLFEAVRSQKWKALAEEVARVASEKPLRFELDMDVQNLEGDPLGHDQEGPAGGQVQELYDYIGDEFELLQKVKCIDFDFQNELTLEEDYPDAY